MWEEPSDDEDGRSRSPKLKAIKVKYGRPSPTPPPFLPQQVVSPSTASNRRSNKRKKPKPSQGDVVLLNYMGSHNHPDVAGNAGKEALTVDSDESGQESGDCDSDEQMEDLDAKALEDINKAEEAEAAKEKERAEAEAKAKEEMASPEAIAKKALQMTTLSPSDTTSQPSPNTLLESEMSPESTRSPGTDISATEHVGGLRIDGVPLSESNTTPSETFKTPIDRKPLSPWPPPEDSLATSPVSEHLLTRAESPARKLPALQNPNSPPEGPGSPQSTTKLPSISNLIETADQTNIKLQRQRQQSLSSVGGPSPIYGGSAGSPPALHPPLAHTSPTLHSASALSPPSASTPLYSGAPFSNFHAVPRRVSNASEATSPRGYPQPLHSASTTESYSHSSTDGYSPRTSPNDTTAVKLPHRMGIDGATRNVPKLPPPLAMVEQISTVPAHGSGGFKCDYPGCNAAPFQTQYLLNSHANVHSTSRPHYCPVPGCPRAEGGKGFKRKNEMIRHGLVHDSPGYVCPFCPDREHKYPRPDNLQRHVRVHHTDRDRDDPKLREVLAQRPEGGSRGRRRRMF